MAHLPFTELSPSDHRILLRLARCTIAAELGVESPPETEAQTRALALRRGVFVTLTQGGALRGCIGTLESDKILQHSVADCARGAAFRDPRFPPLGKADLEAVCVEISVLTAPEPLAVTSRQDLLDVLRPGVDGLLIEDKQNRSTFLPQVWEQLQEPEEFLSHLLLKAGLAADHWSARLRCSRYQCIKFSEADQPAA